MDLHEGETVLYDSTPSWKSQLWFHLGIVLIAVLLGALLYVINKDQQWIGIVAGIAIALLGIAGLWIERSRTRYMVTNERMHVRQGIIAKEIQETRLGRIQNVTIEQSVFERALRIGHVDYDTASSDGSRFRMVGVANPARLIEIVNQGQRDLEERDRRAAARAEAEARASVEQQAPSSSTEPPEFKV